MLKNVLFDIDGTLVDSVDFHAATWQQVLGEFGRDVRFSDIRQQIGKGADQILPMFFSEAELAELEDRIIKRRAEVYQKRYLPQVRPFPGVRDLFRRLHADGLKLALATSSPEKELVRLEEILGVDRWLTAATSADEAERSKPAPDIFEAAAAKIGARPQETIVIGDTPWDAIAARRGGFHAAGVLCGGFDIDDLRDAGCAMIFLDPDDLNGRWHELEGEPASEALV